MTINEILENLPKVKENRNYWFVRTSGGDYYHSFRTGEFIAIGWDQISLEEISKYNTKDQTGFENLKKKIKDKYPEEARPGHAAKQLLKFTYGISKNDIVLIPSTNSEYITFGEVINTPAYNNFDNKYDCPYHKRKEIKWLTTVDRNDLDPHLYRLMFSHHTISEADNYAEYIDKEISSFFIKGDKAHMVLEVQSQNDVKAKELFQMGLLPLEIFDEFCKDENLGYDSDNFNVKLDVQSPGFIEISGLAIGGIIVLGIILISIAGGGFNMNYKKDLKVGFKSDGIIEKVRKYLKTKNNIQRKKELLEKHMKDLNIKNPDELIKILKELDK